MSYQNSSSSGTFVQTTRVSKSPAEALLEKADEWRLPIDSLAFARQMDRTDFMADFRKLFSFPRKRDLPCVDPKLVANANEECVYMCGHSLGLKPKGATDYVMDTLTTWATKGVLSHFNGALPAAQADLPPKAPMSRLVGAKESEVALMNGLTVNLHILMCSFYKPTTWRHKIIIEEGAFSSDMYVVKSQLTFHGYSPETSLIKLAPRPGEYLIREEDALRVIEEQGDSVALILIPGVQFYTGQLFPIRSLTAAAHAKGIVVGADLAHAAGNVPLYIHDWDVDFAVWCTYKYLNAGAGGIGAIFVHERLTEKGATSTFPMLKGWWGNNVTTKFCMRDDFEASSGADMMKMSNPPAVLCAMLMASLDIFSQTSMEKIFQKQFLITGYLEYLIKSLFGKSKTSNAGDRNISNGKHLSGALPFQCVDIITPADPYQRGSQISLAFTVPLDMVHEELEKRGVVVDVRPPNVMRVTPAPLYTSFAEVFEFVAILHEVCTEVIEKLESDKSSDVSTTNDDEEVGCRSTSATSSSSSCINSSSDSD